MRKRVVFHHHEKQWYKTDPVTGCGHTWTITYATEKELLAQCFGHDAPALVCPKCGAREGVSFSTGSRFAF